MFLATGRLRVFLNEAHPFRIAIVCAMWLTGFDVPSLSTLYLDKPLKAHTLMQAIARANRVNEGKNNGLIVDYCGILRHLRKALAIHDLQYSDETGLPTDTYSDDDVVVISDNVYRHVFRAYPEVPSPCYERAEAA